MPAAFVGAALLLLVGAGPARRPARDQEFIPLLDEKSIALNATRIPSTSLTQSQAMQLKVEQAIGRFPQVAYRLLEDRHRRGRLRPDAAELPPTPS